MIQLTVFGRSVFDNPHYVRNRLRNLNSLTYSWNTVTVNRDSQVPNTVDGENQHVGSLSVSLSPITDPYGEGGGENLFGSFATRHLFLINSPLPLLEPPQTGSSRAAT